jgi:hypothetical protein
VDIRSRFDGRGRVVLTASNATQYAFQGDEIIGQGSRSVFTHHLVCGLETGQADFDGDGWISLDELYDYVYERVADETPQQTPGKWTFDLQGEIPIARSPLGRRTPPTEELHLAAQYAEGVDALTAGRWVEALRCFARLEAEQPDYRDVTEQVARLRRLVAVMEQPAAPSSIPEITCPNCGTAARPEARFCPQCGRLLIATTPPPPESTEAQPEQKPLPRPSTLPEEDRPPKRGRPRPSRLPEE